MIQAKPQKHYKGFKNKFIIFIFFSAFGIFACVVYTEEILMIPAKILYVNDSIDYKNDAMICLSGAEVERVQHCMDLFKKNLSERIIVTGGDLERGLLFYQEGKSLASLSKDWLTNHGVPEENILLLPIGTSTYEEAVAVRDFVLKVDYKAIVIVSSPYHMLRVSMVFKKVFRGSKVSLSFSAANSLQDGMGMWWRDEGKIINMFQEYIKLLIYMSKGYIFWGKVPIQPPKV